MWGAWSRSPVNTVSSPRVCPSRSGKRRARPVGIEGGPLDAPLAVAKLHTMKSGDYAPESRRSGDSRTSTWRPRPSAGDTLPLLTAQSRQWRAVVDAGHGREDISGRSPDAGLSEVSTRIGAEKVQRGKAPAFAASPGEETAACQLKSGRLAPRTRVAIDEGVDPPSRSGAKPLAQSLAWTSRRSCSTTDTGGWQSGPPRGVPRAGRRYRGSIVVLSGSTPWLLVIGVTGWLAAAAVTLIGFFWARHELPEPRPGYWSMRFMLVRDTIHAASEAQRS